LLWLLAWPLAARAGEKPEAPADDWYRPLKEIPIGPGTLDIGGSARLRWEYYDNFNIRTYDTGKDDELLLERVRLTFDYHVAENAHAFVMLQDSHYWLGDLSPNDFGMGNPYRNPLDLRQAYFEWEHIGGTPLGFKIGRQAISYRDKRIFGPGDWGNVGRYAWDVAKLYVDTEPVKLDFLAGQRVLYDQRRFDQYHYDFDMWAVYAQVKKLPVKLDLFYVLSYDDHGATVGESGTADHKRHTVGAYLDHSPKKGLDYGCTLACQCGRFGDDDIKAHGGNARIGYTFDAPWSPRVGLEYSFASGDSNPADGDHGTFDGVFGAVDCFYGRMNLFAWKNVHDYQATFSVKPRKGVKIWVDYHYFRLDDARDAWYYCTGRPQRRDPTGASGSGLGHEIDLMAKWQMTKNLELFTGYAHFFPSTFIKRTPGGDGDADWAFIQFLYSF
jgi:hypothetical protein